MKQISKSIILLAGFVIATAAVWQGSTLKTASAWGDFDDGSTRGSITICKIIIDENGTVNDGSLKTGTKIAIHVKESSGGINQIRYKVSFHTPLSLNSDILHHDGIHDAECQKVENLPLGEFHYRKERILKHRKNWEKPLYNDQYQTAVESIDDFYPYKNPISNPDADGVINLSAERPARTLVILNTLHAAGNNDQDNGDSDDDDCDDHDEDEEHNDCDDQDNGNENDLGSITICKIIVDAEGAISTGSNGPGATFSVAGIDFGGNDSVPSATGVLPTASFAVPLTLNADILGNDNIPDASCTAYENLPIGSYYYGRELISNAEQWNTPLYNDQHTANISTLDDFFSYSGELFTEDSADDSSRNTNADGHITLSISRPERTLVVLNRMAQPEDLKECSDLLDNDNDGKIDAADPACHTDGDSDNPDSYKPDADTENSIPEITLIGSGTITLTVGGSFTDPGATAFDEEDGNITDDIVVSGDAVNVNTIGTYVIRYNVEDSDGADANEVTRTVRVETQNNGGGGGSPPPQCADEADNDLDGVADEEDPGCHTDGNAEHSDSYDPNDDDENSKPVITLLGSETISITEGDSFTDPGAVAHDQEDGDITNTIVKVSNVNANAHGSYSITYNVTDSLGAAAEQITRAITVNQRQSAGGGSGTGGGGSGGGGSKIFLEITNEAITLNEAGAAVVTWNTNLQATSMVVYDVIPHGTSTAPALYTDYAFTTPTSTALVTSHSMSVYGLLAGRTYYFRPYSERSDDSELGIELTITPTSTTAPLIINTAITRTPCREYLTSYIKLGMQNNPDDVRKLELFLNTFEGFNLPVDGIYEQRDYDAVVVFQERYFDDILAPWGHTEGTGYVYYTTRKKINETYCRYAFPLSEAQLAEIAEFKALLERLRQSGGSLEDIDFGSTVGMGTTEEKTADTKTDFALEDTSLTARLYDALKDRLRMIGIFLMALAILILGIGIMRSRYPPLT